MVRGGAWYYSVSVSYRAHWLQSVYTFPDVRDLRGFRCAAVPLPTPVITLTLQAPQMAGLIATVTGTLSSTNTTVTRLNWQWGDGSSGDQWFPAKHTYALSGTYLITATAFATDGLTKAVTTTAQVFLDTEATVTVPAGDFQMGCDSNHNGGQACDPSEQPVHTVYLDTYAIDKYEVTNAQYARCVADGLCTAPAQAYSFSHHLPPLYYGSEIFANYPVIYIDWNQASAYCAWAGQRLPTEAEWEKAARGSGAARTYPWGDQAPNCSLANFAPSIPAMCVGDTSPVGSYPAGASPYGAMDMAGNVWEWVSDWYSDTYYSGSPNTNPQGPITGTEKLQRGGSFIDAEDYLTTARRYLFAAPADQEFYVGFRCASSLPPAAALRLQRPEANEPPPLTLPFAPR